MTKREEYTFLSFIIIVSMVFVQVQNSKVSIFRGIISLQAKLLLHLETAGFCHGNKEKKKKMDAWPKEWRKYRSVKMKHLAEMPSDISSIAFNNRA